MRLPSRKVALSAIVAFLATNVNAISKITRTGKYLYQDDGSRFYIKGIAYQEQGRHLASKVLPTNHTLARFLRHCYTERRQ